MYQIGGEKERERKETHIEDYRNFQKQRPHEKNTRERQRKRARDRNIETER
jgi:hypothetical protein